MEFEFHFVRPQPRILNNTEAQATLLRDADRDELRGTPDPEMEGFAQELGRILDADFPSRRLLSATVDTEDPFAVGDIRRAALKHRVSSFLGTSDLFVDASGVSGAIAPELYVTNSLGTAWAQVSERTIDWAFADALRAPVSEGVWVRITTRDPRPDEFGHSMRFHLLESGEVKVVWAKSTNEIFDIQWRQAVTYEEARAQLLAFADRCPTTLHHFWQDPQRHGNAPVAETSIKTCELSQRSQYRLRRLGAFRELPPRVSLRLNDQFEFALELGKDKEGQWRAALQRAPHGGLEKIFESSDTLLEIAEAYTRNERGRVLDFFPESAELQAPAAHVVTAMVLPEREEPWTNSSVCRMHLFMAHRDSQVHEAMEDFLQAITPSLSSKFEIAERQSKKSGEVKFTVQREESDHVFVLLSAAAARHGVSLVVDRSEVLFNPSGRSRQGEWRSTAELFESGQCRNRWEVASPQALLEAMTLNYSNWQLRLTYTSKEHPGCRQILIVEPNGQRCETFTIKAYESENPESGRLHSWTTRESKQFSQGQVLSLIQQTAADPLQLDEYSHWDSWPRTSNGPKDLPFSVSTTTRKPTRLDHALLLKTLKEFAPDEPRGWIEITDDRTPGDFFRIECADHPGWVIAKWGYNHGASQRGVVCTNDIEEAFHLCRLFVDDRWDALEEWQPTAHSIRPESPLHVYIPAAQPPVSHHEIVREFYASEDLSLRSVPPEAEGMFRDLEEFLGQGIEPQRRVTVMVDPSDTERIRGICQIAMRHHAVVFYGETGLLANGVGLDLQVGSDARLINCLGSTWREVSEETLDCAFADALRLSDPKGIWLRVCIGGSKAPEDNALSATLTEDGTWLMTWQYAAAARGVQKEFLNFRTNSYDMARELLLAFADRSPFLEQLPWQTAEGGQREVGIDLTQRNELPLQRFDAVLQLPRETFVPLHTRPGESLLYGCTQDGQWLAMLKRDNGFVATKAFTGGEELAGFARWYATANATEVENMFGMHPPSLEKRWAPRGMAEVSFLMLPQRAEPWAQTTVLHFQHWLAQNNREASEEMRVFVHALQEARSAGLQFTSPTDGAVEARALTSVWVDRAGLLETLGQMSNIAMSHGISMVVNGNHVLLNFARTATDQSTICLMMKGTDSFISETWMQPSTAAFIQAIQRLANGETVVVCNRIHTGSAAPGEDFQEFLMGVENDKQGYCLSYEVPGGIKIEAHELTGREIRDAFEAFVQDPTQPPNSVNWDSFGQSQLPAAESERFEIQSNVFEPAPLGAENVHELQTVRLPKTGDFIQVLDALVEGDYIRVYNDSGRFRTGFLVSWGHDFGQIESFQRKTKSLDEALKLVEHYVAGDRREFVALGWKRRRTKRF